MTRGSTWRRLASTHRISEKDQLFVRYNYGHALEVSRCAVVDGLLASSAVSYNDTCSGRHGFHLV